MSKKGFIRERHAKLSGTGHFNAVISTTITSLVPKVISTVNQMNIPSKTNTVRTNRNPNHQ